MRPKVACAAAALLAAAGCAGTDEPRPPVYGEPVTRPAATRTRTDPEPPRKTPGVAPLRVTDVATDLDTVWSLAWDARGRLWYTQRSGILSRLDGPSVAVEGVRESGEGGLMGLEVDDSGRFYLMYSAADENRIVRLNDDGSQTVLVDDIEVAPVHDGGRLRFGPDGFLYASTGDAGNGALAQGRGLNGKILRIDTRSADVSVFSTGHRNAQGLCFDPDGRLLSTEHGPEFGDEINVVEPGSDGGWPRTSGNGIRNYTPTIAPAGCVYYDDDLIPQWRDSLLFVTLKDQSLRRLTFEPDGSVASEQVLFRGRFGRLRDVAVGPDGAVYLATSNLDGRGAPRPGDDRIIRIAPR